MYSLKDRVLKPWQLQKQTKLCKYGFFFFFFFFSKIIFFSESYWDLHRNQFRFISCPGTRLKFDFQNIPYCSPFHWESCKLYVGLCWSPGWQRWSSGIHSGYFFPLFLSDQVSLIANADFNGKHLFLNKSHIGFLHLSFLAMFQLAQFYY